MRTCDKRKKLEVIPRTINEKDGCAVFRITNFFQIQKKNFFRFLKMHKFIKLFSRPNAASTENKPKPYNESVTKRKINEKNKKIEKTKSSSSENLLNIKPAKRNSSSVENINQTCEVLNNGTLKRERDSAVSLESILLSEEKSSATMEKQKRTSVKKIPKSPSSSNLLSSRKDAEKIRSNKTSPIKSLAARNVPDPKFNELKSKMEKIIEDSKNVEERLTESLKTREAEIEKLKSEIKRLTDEKNAELESLANENMTLRTRLRDAVQSPVSDSEKEQTRHNSAPPSISATNEMPCQELDGVEGTCPTPDWDKHSCSSLSEVSVACLQDRIMQMEETHHSTNEELQATLQELADLQTQLMDLQSENERLLDEKNVLLESLCRQTEKLEDSRSKVDTLQELLLKGKEGDCCTEREQKLVDLLKSAQDERETLLLKQEELNNQLAELRNAADSGGQEADRLIERVKLLEFTIEATNADRKQIDQELVLAKEESNSRHIEINRLNTLLDNAKAKIVELEQARNLLDKSEVDQLMDNARKEKDMMESQIANLQEQLSRSRCEVNKLKEQVRQLQEECKVIRNNTKSKISNLEYQLEQLKEEKSNLAQELQESRESAAELQVQAQCHLEDKLQLKSVLSETQKHLVLNEKKMSEMERILNEEKKIKLEKYEEWEQFQSDLLMTVRVANDLKTEAQHQAEELIAENKILKERIKSLEAQIDKLKVVKLPSPTPTTLTDTSASVLNSVQQDLANRRTKQGISRQDSRLSVKSLIESIENATKQAKAGPGSRSSSTSSLSSIASDVRCSVPTISTTSTTGIQGRYYSDTELVKTNQANNKSFSNNQNNKSRNIILNDCQQYKQDITPVSILSNKNMDFVRRNSYSDLSERKDPLSALVKNGGSKRNALLKWCQNKTLGYKNIDITNFSSSWNDGLGFCALLHTYLPDKVPYDTLVPNEKRRNFQIAFDAAESVGIHTSLNITDMVQLERPDWQQVMAYITAIYKHFET